MKLQSLRLHGFKSFADRTTLDLREGVTAIVGSNGCGKSNIADAIRWVLGEQRASAVRGARMDEVIFQGSARRRPLNFAEVSLLFSNEAGRIAVPQAEIELARKVFREGGSEYSLNREACRLRDIHGLLRDTGLGSNAYAVIEAGMIETLLSDRADERRTLFEEAAGIGRYKDSRRAATRRLEAAEADLARLGDLLAEVESGVRSLARQRKRAQRHRELQARRLDLEVALTAHELERGSAELTAAEQRLQALTDDVQRLAAERAAADALAERCRLEAVELGRRRAPVAAQVETVRDRLAAREREALVAGERRSHAELRLQQVVRERAELTARAESLAAEIERSRLAQLSAAGVMEGLRQREAERAGSSDAVRAAVMGERGAAREAGSRAEEVARALATAHAERAAARARVEEAAARAGRHATQLERLDAEMADAGTQTELWDAQADTLRERLETLRDMDEAAREEVRVLRARDAGARAAQRAADETATRLEARLAAREALERSYEGFTPAVAALMARRERFAGVLGPLADFVYDTARGRAAGYERYLGALLQAVVVRDLATARAVRDWFVAEWSGGGSLLLIPLDTAAARGTPAPHDGGGWDAAAWLNALAEVEFPDADPLLDAGRRGVVRVGPGGEVVDERGVVRLSGADDGEGLLQRRAELERLREECAAAAAARAAARGEAEAVAALLEEAGERAAEVEELRRAAEQELRRAEADAAAHAHQGARLARDRDEAARALAAARTAADEAGALAAQLEGRIDALTSESARLSADAEAMRARLLDLEARWEAARDEDAELRVAVTRADAEVREAERRASGAVRAAEAARQRTAALESEAAELRHGLESLAVVSARAGTEIESLFRARDEAAAELARLEERLAEVEAQGTQAQARARAAQRAETELAEERHRLELRAAELRSAAERARDRLEVEWARPWETLLAAARPVEGGSPAAWAAENRETAAQLEALGPVNMLAVEEHEEQARRLDFLLEQRADLTRARDDLAAAIRQINRTAREVFLSTFATIRENFHRVYGSLFPGGQCDLWLAEPDDPLESPVEIQASPSGKKTQRIHLLSGGERTLTALSLLFALYLVKPSPFCVLDEVDAPLDEANVLRFVQLLHDFKAETQFIVITHNPRTMEAADWIYGVTMEEPGISSIVGVELQGAWAMEDQVA